MRTQVSPLATVTLNGSGAGRVAIGPPSGARWRIDLATVSTTSTVNQSTCTLYRGSTSGPVEQIDFTNQGNGASSTVTSALPYFGGQVLWAVWAGGDPGAVATLQAYGEQRARGDAPFEPGVIGPGFASIPTSLIAGNPGGGRVVIGSNVPAELVTFYAAAGVTINVAWIGQYFSANDYRYQITGNSGTGGYAATGFVVGGVVLEEWAEVYNAGQVSQSFGGNNVHTVVNHFDSVLNVVRGNPPPSTADFQFNGISAGRDLLQSATVQGNPIATATGGGAEVPYFSIGSRDFLNGRLYRSWLRLSFNATAAAGQLTVRLRAGTGTGGGQRFIWRFPITSVALTDQEFTGYMRCTAAVTQDMTYTVQAAAGSNISFFGTGVGTSGQGQQAITDAGDRTQWDSNFPIV